jgi:hypothetical protein
LAAFNFNVDCCSFDFYFFEGMDMLKILLAISLVLAITGCATPANRHAMTVPYGETIAKPSEKLKGQVFVRHVLGGEETNPLWKSKVDNATFKSALEASLDNAGYKSDSSSAKYVLDATLQDLQQPAIGLTFDVQSFVSYTVTNEGSTKSMPINAVGSATFSDAPLGMERMKMANERAIKENIKAMINKLTAQFGN